MKLGSLLLPVILVVFYVAVVAPQSRRRKQAAVLQRAVEPGSRVLLTSGLYGVVVEVEDDAIILLAAPGVELRYAKGAILTVIHDEPEAPDDLADDETHPHDDEDPEPDEKTTD